MDENNNLNKTQDSTPQTYDKPVSAFDNTTPSGNTDYTSAPDNNAAESVNSAKSVNTTDMYENTYSSPYETNSTISTAPEVVSTGFGIASLILGILSIPCNCCYGLGILFSILGIIFGILQQKDFNGKKPGTAIAGIICSSIGIIIAIIEYVIIFIAAFASSY
ncbi:MAG: DUF4190 domain-containing protein [Lachnospiraceae bacterium]|nr:DUF4190 domain-containing protein [Lachnospiraceae bacterium]